jgi:hypothetical protein
MKIAPNVYSKLEAYAAGFEKCYPTFHVSFSPAKGKDGSTRWNVHINGDKGSRPLSMTEIEEATTMFGN